MLAAERREQQLYSSHKCDECGARLLFNHILGSDEVIGYYHRCEALPGHPFLSVGLDLKPESERQVRISGACANLRATLGDLRRLGVSKGELVGEVRKFLNA